MLNYFLFSINNKMIGNKRKGDKLEEKIKSSASENDLKDMERILEKKLEEKNNSVIKAKNECKIISIIAPENTMNLKGIGEKPEDFESIESKDKKYTILGKGAFGYAEKMKSKLNNKIYAIKRILVKKDLPKDFIRETSLMLQSNHMNIVKLYLKQKYYIFQEKEKNIIIMIN